MVLVPIYLTIDRKTDSFSSSVILRAEEFRKSIITKAEQQQYTIINPCYAEFAFALAILVMRKSWNPAASLWNAKKACDQRL